MLSTIVKANLQVRTADSLRESPIKQQIPAKGICNSLRNISVDNYRDDYGERKNTRGIQGKLGLAFGNDDDWPISSQ